MKDTVSKDAIESLRDIFVIAEKNIIIKTNIIIHIQVMYDIVLNCISLRDDFDFL